MKMSNQLGVYRDLLKLVWKYGGSPLVEAEGHDDALQQESAPPAAELAEDLEHLGPAFVKIGQLLSSQLDVLAKPYAEALDRLQTQVEPFDFEQVRAVISSELGAPPSELFEAFEEKPVAAGSLAQVHAATLAGGQRVAVKVQRPDARASVREHMAGLAHVASLLDAYYGHRYGLVEILDHTRQLLERELDFEQERRNLEAIGNQLESPHLHVPAPVRELSTSRVLTMEFIPGTPITDLAHAPSTGAALADALFCAYLDQFLVKGVFHADPHPGNVLYTEDGRLAIIDLGMVEHVAPRMRGNLLQLALAITNGEGERTAELATKLGRPQRAYDHVAFQQELSEQVMAFSAGGSTTALGRVLVDVANTCAKHGVSVPPLVAIVGKALVNLDQTARILDPQFDSPRIFAREKRRLLAQFAAKTTSPDDLVIEGIELKQALRDTPRRLNAFLDNLAREDKGLRINAIDEQKLLNGIEKIANRITHGLVIAALLVTGALLMKLDSTLTMIAAWAMLAIAMTAIILVLLSMLVYRNR